MDRRSLRTAVVLVMLAPVSACVVPPGGYQASQAGYPPAVYPAPGYTPPGYQSPDYQAPAYSSPTYQAPAYQPPAYQQGYYPPPASATAYADDQYTYVDGIPYAVYGGQQEVVVFDNGLGWGFYDPDRRWHRAPERWRNDFDHRYPGGHGYSPPPPRDFGARPGFAPGSFAPGGRPPDPALRPGAFQEPRGQRAPEPPPSRPEVFHPSQPAFRQGGEPRPGGEPPGGRPGGFAPRGEEQRVNAPQPPRPQAAPPPQQHAAPPPQPPHGGGMPACGQAGAPRC